jgi:hypothetical protein
MKKGMQLSLKETLNKGGGKKLIRKIVNSETGQVVYQGSISYDHGYWVRIYDISLLTKGKKDSWEFSEYYGGKYQLIEESEEDDKKCYACGRPLPKKDVIKPHKPYDLIVCDIIESNSYGEKSYMVEFR